MEDEEIDDCEDGGSMSSFALPVARGNNACSSVEEIATRRGSPNLVSRKKKKNSKQDGVDSSLQQDSQLNENGNGNEGEKKSSFFWPFDHSLY